jgi:tRNA-splicing ligase RtcB
MKKEVKQSDLIKISDYLYEIPQSFRDDMRVPARIFANQEILNDILTDRSLEQLVNVATLPGIVKAAMAMPDIHQGYGFPIGGVAAMVIDEGGVISPGGIGYDINCGVRLLVAELTADEVRAKLGDLATDIFNAVPSGVGQGGRLEYGQEKMDKILQKGAQYMLEQGYGVPGDIEFCEENGCMPGADPQLISDRAKKRGGDQLGTLGSGNHFLEVQEIVEIYDEDAAKAFGLKKGLVTIMIHCGSRGLGHQVCTDYVKIMNHARGQWGIDLPDRELICAPFKSKEGQDYYKAMEAAANFAWANRHMIGHWVREVWQKHFGKSAALNMVYDVSHNIGKVEIHEINGKWQEVIMHRKGATRAFGPGLLEVPEKYRHVGQPVLIPGTMGTSSYILAGTSEGMKTAFGSSCHGAGRRLSRTSAKKSVHGTELRKRLEKEGIIIRCDSDAGLAEEAPIAYKDVDNVVDVVVQNGIAKRVARVKPIAVIKGG